MTVAGNDKFDFVVPCSFVFQIKCAVSVFVSVSFGGIYLPIWGVYSLFIIMYRGYCLVHILFIHLVQ